MNLPAWINKSPNRPPNDEIGTEYFWEICSAVGHLTSTWERCEHSLSLLYASMFPGSFNEAKRSFGSILGSGARCDMVAAASAGQNDRVTDLLKAYRRISSIRNNIAHGMILNEKEKFYEECDLSSPRGNFYVVPALYNENKMGDYGIPKIFYNAKTLTEITIVITHLIKECQEIAFDNSSPSPSTENGLMRYLIWKK
ncbi:hypothetical protein [Breoghania sp.]|uniref:hypothetical protein n=1 Tax=Breoghania sp. TaxID=2065378 RepID=UPI002AABAC10|nr:hypothetical protein [Breoghania sp.]